MSVGLNRHPRRLPRPAPSGLLPPDARVDRVPHAWKQVDAGVLKRLANRSDLLILMATTWLEPFTRREFVKRVGKAGLVLGSGLTIALWPEPPAAADPCGKCGDPCGPSPLCGGASGHCNTQGECAVSAPGVVDRRFHDTFTCGGTINQNCWNENCCTCSAQGDRHHYQCCDCCVTSSIGHACNCGGFACICRSILSNDCP
jgi:hypothetical protein